MAKRGYKLQEFVAQPSNVNCLRIGKKAGRLLLTGGDDHKANLWAIGKPTSLMSLCGHTSPVESLAFDSTEVLVLAGASSGTVKLWDLEEGKMVRTLTGHRSNCASVEFHPFGEFFASGSADTDLKIWDIRKKGCIHTYKGHTQEINTIKFTPDGRWVVSGGLDNVVKIWDLTAGKLLHDFNNHRGAIRSIDFHPLEFLLATGSADKTIKFWDLESFEMIGSSRAEYTGVRKVAFHPDGGTLFCGYDNNLKVRSWEPIICHDILDIGWSTLRDFSIHEGKVIGCSSYQNSVGVWVADISCIKPYGSGDSSRETSPVPVKADMLKSWPVEKAGPCARSSPRLRSTSPDNDVKEIKNIYVDYEKPIGSQKKESPYTPKVSPSNLKETATLPDSPATKQSPPIPIPIPIRSKSNDQTDDRSFVWPSFVPRETSRRESFTPAIKAAHTMMSLNRVVNYFDTPLPEVQSEESFEDENPALDIYQESFQRNRSPTIPSMVHAMTVGSDDEEKQSVKVAVAHGKTRSLVEKFERRAGFNISDNLLISTSPEVIADKIMYSTSLREDPQISGRELTSLNDAEVIHDLMQNHDDLLSDLRSRLTKLQMIRTVWERNDIKGAINGLNKLSDHSVQADVIGVIMEKMEMISMDLFSCLLPILVGLLDSKIERHIKMSMEMILKLVAMFGSTIHRTISAPAPVGVDLHQEERIECSRQCFKELQQIQSFLPALSRRSSSLAKSSLELNIILQDHNI